MLYNSIRIRNTIISKLSEISHKDRDLKKIDKSGNKLLIKASPKKITEIETIISSIDVPALQIMLEARLIEVSMADEEKLGIDWAKLSKLTTIVAENAAPIPATSGTETGSLVPGMTYIVDDLGNLIETFEPQATGQVPGEMYFQRIDPGKDRYTLCERN